MAMNRAQFQRQLQLGLNANFGLEYNRHQEQWRQLFDVVNSSKAFEEDQLLIGFGGAATKPEGGAVTYDSGGEGWTARYAHETIALAFAITEEAIEDGLYGDLGSKYSPALARSLQHTKEVKGAAIFNNGFDPNHAGGDGKPLFATDHPLAGGGTFANAFDTPADLSETSLEEALTRISEFVDDRGIPVSVMAKMLAVPPQLQFTAQRLLRSQKRPGTADNDINAIADMDAISGGYTVNQRFTDPDAWFIKTDCPQGLKHFVRKKVQRGMEGDFETGNLRYKSRERYSFGWTDPRGAFGSPGGGN
ncbi:Mu-like prophage major head subunit gpT family protein [Salinisphaera hydrothermalis]|uniref:Uncharacterized protein n=1 Tax=Salinisphaera hydrothermalis (strain C41B8) TaxID=1304275 RepID=A0A084INM9_SALHC|nr:Mu-like prophage major head subunit gpT family protein [Salinisphaera hydrothermalis]KEZ78313.1 hypothetical protein C41B8_05408 [Salinisphaera hydrothermalis C41B8]